MDLNAAPGIAAKDAKTLQKLIKSIKDATGEERHAKWLQEIKNGSFSFGAPTLSYKPKGVGSWKHRAIKQRAASDTGREIFPYDEKFLSSNWKMFHDALQAHRFDIVHDILPRYGICVA